MRAQYEISTRTYHVGACLLRHSMELVVVGCTVHRYSTISAIWIIQVLLL